MGVVGLVDWVDAAPSCTRLVLLAPHVRLQTATSLGAGASVSAGTRLDADGKGQHVMVLNIACGCAGCAEAELSAQIFALRVRAEVQVSARVVG